MSLGATSVVVGTSSRVQQTLAFLLPAALLVYYALKGGSYDIVVRQEEALGVWWFLGLGWLFGLFPRTQIPRLGLVTLGACALLAIWMAVGLSWTDSDERTLAEVARTLHYLGLLTLAWSLCTRELARYAVAGITVAAVVVCGFALASRLAPGLFTRSPVERLLKLDRLSYPLNYWNAVAAWSVVTIVMLLAWAAHARRLLIRSLALAAVPACVLVVYLTYSRAGVGGVLLGVLVVFALGRNRWTTAVQVVGVAIGAALAILVARGQPQIVHGTGGSGAAGVALAVGAAALVAVAAVFATDRLGTDRLRMAPQRARVVVGALAVVAILVAVVPLHGPIKRGWHQFKTVSTTADQSSANPAARFTTLGGERYHHWQSAVKAFDAHPLRGIGAGTFEFWWNRHGATEFSRDAHSIYIENLGETGVVGFALVLVLLGSLCALALVRLRQAVDAAEAAPIVAATAAIVVYLFHAGVDWMWETTAFTALVFVAVACATAGSARTARVPRLPLRAAIALAALVCIAVELPAVVSTSRVRASQTAIKDSNPAAAFLAAQDAVAAEPWAASPYVQRALVLESTGRLAEARADVQRAIKREPDDWRTHLILARVDAESGHAVEAVSAWTTAKRLRPASPFLNVPTSG